MTDPVEREKDTATEPGTMQYYREISAQAWCHPLTSGTEMDPNLCDEFAAILKRECERKASPVVGDDKTMRLEKDLEFYRKRRGELVRERDNALRLLNNWLAWWEQDHGSLGAIEPETRAALQSSPPPVTGEPLTGAVVNGLALLYRLRDHYDFECEAGPLKNCTDFHDLERCLLALQSPPPVTGEPDWSTMLSVLRTLSQPDYITPENLRDAYSAATTTDKEG